MFVCITLANGERHIGEFSKLKKVGAYADDVLRGRKTFNVWRVVGGTHPANGEPCLMRTRQKVNSSQITCIEEVEPVREDHEYQAVNFRGVARPQSGKAGLHRFTEPVDPTAEDAVPVPDGARTDVEYPVHRDPESGRRFVWLSYDITRHYLDPEPAAYPVTTDMEGGQGEEHEWDDESGDDDF